MMQPSINLADSAGLALPDPEKCGHCGAAARLGSGSCVQCLLGQALGGGEASEDEFARGLNEDDVPDVAWRLGNYEILGEIGRGGMGVIYRARQRHSKRIVALKRVLGYHADSLEWLERFRREAEAAASLDHPNILPIYEVSESEDGLPYFSMKWAPGGSLRELGPSLANEPRNCVVLIAKVARAIEYAHTQGILHRDLQPGNILLDARGEPLVCDFGLAKWLDGSSDLTRTMTTFGTPGYIAPEQAEGPATDLKPSADIYSLGAVLFNLLAKRPPFLGANALSVIHQAAANEAPKLRSIVPSLDRDLETIVARCLEREPRARYHSANDLAEDLERWLGARRIVARPVSVPAQIWRWVRHNPTFAAMAAACLVLGGVILWPLGHPSAPLSTTRQKNSIAVLPFENFTPDEGSRFFGDAMQDDILTGLSKVADLKVISRSSVRDYKPGAPRNIAEIAKALGVRNVLEGSVRRMDGRFRINARLIDAQTGAQIWADQYERDLASIFATQGEIAETIAAQLRVKLSVAEKAAIAQRPTSDVAAYDLFAEASELVVGSMGSKDAAVSLKKAVLLLEEATRRDPAFVLAYCELAHANENLYWNEMDQTPERLARARQAMETAVRLAPAMGETHLARARYLYIGARDFDAAGKELELAQRALPNDSGVLVWKGLVARRQNHWDEGLHDIQRAYDLDPRNADTIRALADTLLEMRQYPAMERLLKRALIAIPQQATVFFAKLADCYLAQGNPKAVVAMLSQMPPNQGPSGFQAYYRFTIALYLGEYVAAKQAVAGNFNVPDSFKGPFCPPVWFEALVSRAQKDDKQAASDFGAAQQWTRTAWGEEPDDPARLGLVARIDAALGHKEDAIRRGKAALASRPLERDSLEGPTLAVNLALVYAWVGERDLALEQLSAVAKMPAGPSYGDLQMNPRWDSLRDEPRFTAIVESLRPSL